VKSDPKSLKANSAEFSKSDISYETHHFQAKHDIIKSKYRTTIHYIVLLSVIFQFYNGYIHVYIVTQKADFL